MSAFFQIVASNLVFATVLALAALVVERFMRRPALAHLLWLVVFVKLLSPPLISFGAGDIPFLGGYFTSFFATEQMLPVPEGWSQATPDTLLMASAPAASAGQLAQLWGRLESPLFVIWFCGSGMLVAVSLIRAYRFNRWITEGFSEVPQEVEPLFRELASRMGITARRVPGLRFSSAELSPLVWWMGGRVSIVLPRSLLESLSLQELKWVLGHELAHVQRKDYQVRWLEWLACIAFWWNPLVWWGRRHLRLNEEICCDALVLERLEGRPYDYAQSLLNAVERLSPSTSGCAPLVASQVNSGGRLEKRLRMLMALGRGRLASAPQRVCLLLVATLVLPLACLSGKTKPESEHEEAGAAETVAALAEPAPLPELPENGDSQLSIPTFSTTAVVQGFDLQQYRQILKETQKNMKEAQEVMAKARRQTEELQAQIQEHLRKMPAPSHRLNSLPPSPWLEEQLRALYERRRMLEESDLVQIMSQVSKNRQRAELPGALTHIEIRLGRAGEKGTISKLI